MTAEEILKTANIHFESATFRVHVNNVDAINFDSLEETKPDFVMFVSKSNDRMQNKSSILVSVAGEYDLLIMADWLEKNGGIK